MNMASRLLLLTVFVSVCSGCCVAYVVTVPAAVVSAAFMKKHKVHTSQEVRAKDGAHVYFLQLSVPLTTLQKADGPELLFFSVIARSQFNPAKPCVYRIFAQKIRDGKKVGGPAAVLEWRIKHPHEPRWDIQELFFDPVRMISDKRTTDPGIIYRVRGKKAEREQFLAVLEKDILGRITQE
jgi:hypothetical protein